MKKQEKTEKGCEFCDNTFISKRAEARFCSGRCKQQAYLTRKDNKQENKPENKQEIIQKQEQRSVTGNSNSLKHILEPGAIVVYNSKNNNSDPTNPVESLEITPPKEELPVNKTGVKAPVNLPVFLPVNKSNFTDKEDVKESVKQAVNNFTEQQAEQTQVAVQKPVQVAEVKQGIKQEITESKKPETVTNPPDYQVRKQQEWKINKIIGADMASKMKRWRPYEQENVQKANKQLKKWIKTMIIFHKDGGRLRELKNLLMQMKQYQQSIDYQLLPKDYPYLEYIKTLIEKLKMFILRLEMDGDKYFRALISEETKIDMTYVLMDIEL